MLLVSLRLLAICCALQAPTTAPADLPPDPSPEAVEQALTTFSNSLADIQLATLADLDARIAALKDVPLLRLRDQAKKAIKPVPRPPVPFHDPKEFTPGEAARGVAVRTVADPESQEAADKRGRFRPQDNLPPFAWNVRWDLGADRAYAEGAEIPPYGRLHNALNGYVPDIDVLVAWLTSQFDFDNKVDAVASFFGNAYGDLGGKVYVDVTLYDAWSSGSGVDMPDIDTIAFAKKILKDHSYVAPLPPDAHRQKLYDAMSKSFLDWFRYRVWIEAAAFTFVNPEAEVLRDQHEPMRRRLLCLFAQEKGDVARIARKLKEFGNRDAFITAMDAVIGADPKIDRTIEKFVDQRAAERWAIARAAYTALRAQGLLNE